MIQPVSPRSLFPPCLTGSASLLSQRTGAPGSGFPLTEYLLSPSRSQRPAISSRGPLFLPWKQRSWDPPHWEGAPTACVVPLEPSREPAWLSPGRGPRSFPRERCRWGRANSTGGRSSSLLKKESRYRAKTEYEQSLNFRGQKEGLGAPGKGRELSGDLLRDQVQG